MPIGTVPKQKLLPVTSRAPKLICMRMTSLADATSQLSNSDLRELGHVQGPAIRPSFDVKLL